MDKKQLWLNLNAYNFNHLVPSQLWDQIREKFGGPDASTKAFANKIARKLKWTDNFALKAITEYKKFIYLGVVSDFAVTPSKILDQVWHEHILFNKAYRQFCNEVIQYEFDHNPELVPAEDQTGVFNAQFLETIQLYKSEFGIDPPADIWGTPKYNRETLLADVYESRKKEAGSYYADNMPLYMYFDSSSNSDSWDSSREFDGFDEGSSGGAGSSSSWGDSPDPSSDSTSDGASSGSCSSSSCSSGCGGGGD